MLKPKHSASVVRSNQLATYAFENRHSPSEPERKLWCELSAGRLGVSFRRQVVLGNAMVDFFAPALRLVVEVDGARHRQRIAADARRDRELRRLGFEVLQVPGSTAMSAPEVTSFTYTVCDE